jgi:hypothetical protein
MEDVLAIAINERKVFLYLGAARFSIKSRWLRTDSAPLRVAGGAIRL